MLFGIVKDYFPNKESPYGFIGLECAEPTSPDVLFGFKQGRVFDPEKGLWGNRRLERTPVPGDRIAVYLERAFHVRDFQTRRWTFADTLPEDKQGLPPPRLRVVAVRKEDGKARSRMTLWEGTDVLDLNMRYPRPKNPCDDPLKPIVREGFTLSPIFDRLGDEGWCQCPDPRLKYPTLSFKQAA